MRTKISLLLMASGFLLIGVAMALAQQNPVPAGNAPGARPGQPAGGPQGPGGPGPGGPGAGGPGRAQPPPFAMMSTSMADGSFLAVKYTCTAGPTAVSPDLHWMNAPRDTASFVLIVHDMEPRPRKGLDDILHWMVWNIPATATQIPEAVSSGTQQLPDGSMQTNGNPGQGGNTGYRPPCPPAGPSHHYAFELFAVDQKLDLPGAATRADVLKAMDGHILAHAALITPYHQ
jgi:Raf kinase inhibitor-like YbhB/YbcL family protein